MSEKLVLLRFLFSDELMSEADTKTVKNESSMALIVEYSKPRAPIRGKKAKTIDMTTTITNENTTLLEKSMLSNFIEDPICSRKING